MHAQIHEHFLVHILKTYSYILSFFFIYTEFPQSFSVAVPLTNYRKQTNNKYKYALSNGITPLTYRLRVILTLKDTDCKCFMLFWS